MAKECPPEDSGMFAVFIREGQIAFMKPSKTYLIYLYIHIKHILDKYKHVWYIWKIY